jgi:hypothetical protein
VYSGSAWVTKSGGSSPLTTKGDLYTYSTTDARLPVGTNGHTLVADSATATGLKWAAASSGSLTKITSASFTTQSSVAIDGCFDSTYTKYFCIYSVTPSTNLAELHLQFRYAGPTTQTANYYGSGRVQVRFNTGTNFGYDTTGEAVIAADLGVGSKSFGEIFFESVGNSSEIPVFFGAGFEADGNGFSNFGGMANTARTYTGFLIKPSTGTITGTYAVYGYTN